jgi:hypothetical protein
VCKTTRILRNGRAVQPGPSHPRHRERAAPRRAGRLARGLAVSVALGLAGLVLGSALSFDLRFTRVYSGSGDPDRLVLLLLDPDTNRSLVYEIKADNNFDADADLQVQIRFRTEIRAPGCCSAGRA